MNNHDTKLCFLILCEGQGELEFIPDDVGRKADFTMTGR